METILEETVATEDLKKFEQKYHVELNNGKVNDMSLCCFQSHMFVARIDQSVQHICVSSLLLRFLQSLSSSTPGVW